MASGLLGLLDDVPLAKWQQPRSTAVIYRPMSLPPIRLKSLERASSRFSGLAIKSLTASAVKWACGVSLNWKPWLEGNFENVDRLIFFRKSLVGLILFLSPVRNSHDTRWGDPTNSFDIAI